MIYWKCSVGIAIKVPEVNDKLEDTFFYDNSYFTIFTETGITRTISRYSNRDITTAQSKLLETIGSEILSGYGFLTNTPDANEKYVFAMFDYLPFLKTSAPITFNKVLEDNYSGISIYIPSLNKLLVYWGQSSTYICSVSNGLITDVYSNQYVFGDLNGSYGNYICPILKNYTSSIDLSNPDNYLILVVDTTSTPLYRYEVIKPVSGFINSISKIFSTTSKPDGSGTPSPGGPFDPIPPSGGNVPGGQFDDQSDIIGDSSLPTLSASDTGFTRIYIPTLSQVKDLARYLWTDDTVIETIWNKIKQFFENPMEAIIGFNLVPVPVPSSGTKSFALMYIDTGVDMDTAANQFVDVDCGTLPIQLYYGSALDYSPYTKISCYLPYIGMVQLNTDEVVGRTLQVKYRIDIVSGSCVAKIFVDGNCIYQYSGHCAITIPISASDFSSYVSAAISVAKLAVGAATGGAGGAAAAALNADINQQTGSMFSVQGGSDNSGQIQLFAQGGASGPGTQAEPEIKNTQASFSGITPQNLANTVGEIMTAKPHVQHSGSFSGNSGYLGVRRPFVIIERPNLCLPENYQGLNGFPAMITMLLGECSGYTKVQQMVLSGCTATNPEQAEIMSLLKGGVIL